LFKRKLLKSIPICDLDNKKKYWNHIGNLFIYFNEILNSFKSCGILPSCNFFPQDGFDRQSPSCIYESRRPLSSVALRFLETISIMHLWVRETISICTLVRRLLPSCIFPQDGFVEKLLFNWECWYCNHISNLFIYLF